MNNLLSFFDGWNCMVTAFRPREATEAITATRQKQINIYHVTPVSEVGIIPVATSISKSTVLLTGNKNIKNKMSVENT
jgi:hypothetical protein